MPRKRERKRRRTPRRQDGYRRALTLNRPKGSGCVEITHSLLEADVRLVHGHHRVIDRPVVGRVHAQKPHVVGAGFVIVRKRLLGFGK